MVRLQPSGRGVQVELRMDLGQPVQGIVGAMQPSHLWLLSPATVDDGPLAQPTGRPYSYWAECECPDDCPRDHENE